MAKYSGKIGFAVLPLETEPGVWNEFIEERPYYGNVIRNARRLQTAGVNDDIEITNRLSVIADAYAFRNFHMIRYVTFMGSKWKVTDVEVEYPRLLLSLGGLYNEQT